MPFISGVPRIVTRQPLFSAVLANTMLSTVPGISGAGPSPEKTLLTPVLDAELITRGEITSMPVKPNTPTGCPTPASITRSMMELSGLHALFINAGLVHRPTVPCLDAYGEPGADPRFTDAVPGAEELFGRGQAMGIFLGRVSDLLVLGECVPGGTTTAMCVLRGLGYHARVSSSFSENPVRMKEDVWDEVSRRLDADPGNGPLDVVRVCGDPMIALSAGIYSAYPGTLMLAGGTQMLAVAAVAKGLGLTAPRVVTTCYVRDDASANFAGLAGEIGAEAYYVDPGFGDLGHSGLARYCIGEVKEGMGAGGAMFLAALLGHSPEAIREKIFEFVRFYD